MRLTLELGIKSPFVSHQNISNSIIRGGGIQRLGLKDQRECKSLIRKAKVIDLVDLFELLDANENSSYTLQSLTTNDLT